MWLVNTSLVVLALQLASSSYAAPGLKLKLITDDVANGVDDLLVKAIITNTGDQDLELYPEPNGLISSMPTKSFKVYKETDGTSVQFIGAKAKYVFSTATHLVSLKVGENFTATHHLSKAYLIPEEGTYEIIPAVKTFYYKDSTTGQPTPLIASVETSGGNISAKVKVTGSLKSRHVEKRKEYYDRVHKRSGYPLYDAVKRNLGSIVSSTKRATTTGNKLEKRIAYANCNDQQQGEILQASYIASLYTADAEKYLTLHTSATERYSTWFGEYDSTNHDNVLSHFTNIRTSDLKTYTYDCSCEEENSADLYAYVFPDEFGHVHLCGQFMQAAVSGADSKAGTMVHEATHFTRNGGTEDIAYSRELAQQLAATNTTGAVLNADSHEYFAENTPKLG